MKKKNYENQQDVVRFSAYCGRLRNILTLNIKWQKQANNTLDFIISIKSFDDKHFNM